jgi:xanthine/CO dehydrogenase XdhC/CoxF family maturation factor
MVRSHLMKEFLAITAALRATTTPSVLATLVKAEGSSYRRTGARSLWREGAARLGSISGGCLEEDLALHAAEVRASGDARVVVYDTTDENDLVWGAGLGCHGVVHVLLERIGAGAPPALAFVEAAWARREAVALATVFQAAGAREREVPPLGPAFALAERGETWRAANTSMMMAGAQEQCFDAARETLRARRSASRALAVWPGAPEVFFEFLPPPPALVIFGAGDDAQPLARLAAELGWLVTVIDARPAYATALRFPEASRLIVARGEEAVAAAPLEARALVVVMTHRYLDDLPILRALLPRPLAYLGLLGPKKRAEKILADLAREGCALASEQSARLHAPVGLDLGGATPEEVALAILAEMQAVRWQRDARPLRGRTRPIHHD